MSVVVVGGGPAGLAAALLLARLDIETVAIFPPAPPGRDRRTAALFAGSVEFLRNLGVWEACAAMSAPMRGIRIIDATGRLLRAPETTFRADEQGLDAFGFNVPNAALVAALQAAAERDSRLSIINAEVEEVTLGAGAAKVRTGDGREIVADLVVGADGRQSLVRRAAGIGVTSWDYPQTAVVTQFGHQRPHHDISTEFHRPNGPLTTVPMPGAASSLVWVDGRDEAGRLAAVSEDDFRDALEEHLCGLLGSVVSVGPRGTFPLSGLKADVLARDRVALIGEAGHVMPPIGAQGLNLGLRDVAALGESLVAAGGDAGRPEVLADYAAARAPDVASRMMAIDALNRSLLTPFLPAHLVRGFGLFALGALAPLRRLVVGEGLAPTLAAPAAMSPGGLERLAKLRRSGAGA